MDQMATENCSILSAKESLRTLEGMICGTLARARYLGPHNSEQDDLKRH